MKQLITLVLIGFALALITGCAQNLRGDYYTRGEARAPQRVEYGTVQHVRLVVIEGTKTPIGAGAGAAAGGIAGSTVGDGATGQVGAVVGAVLGGVAGAAVEEGVTRTQGVEITVRLDDGKILAYVQGDNPHETFRVGERVRVLTSGDGISRVMH